MKDALFAYAIKDFTILSLLDFQVLKKLRADIL